MLSMHSTSPSPMFQTPSTPGRSSYYSARSHQPLVSSPLASPKSSPAASAQARRRAQYKTRATSFSRTPLTLRQPLFAQASIKTPEDSQTSLLRDRFRAKCLERAQQQRQERVRRQRTASSSDDEFFDSVMDCDEDEDEDEESVMQDELFRRIVAKATHKENHAFRLSYCHDVGSSFDPDMEDVSRWESELQAPEGYCVTPEDLEQEEIEAYAAEYAEIQELSNLGVATDDFSAWSDIEDTPMESSADRDMDLS